MKKLATTALAALIATVGMVSAASADSRNGDDEWRRRGHNSDGNRWDDRRGNDEWRNGGRRHHWRNQHRPRVVYRYDRDVCWVKKVRRYDDWGNAYIKRVRVCQ